MRFFYPSSQTCAASNLNQKKKHKSVQPAKTLTNATAFVSENGLVPAGVSIVDAELPTIPSPCKGDFDTDGDVGGSDLAVFAADFGRTDCP